MRGKVQIIAFDQSEGLYTIQPGDTLHSIAVENETTEAALLAKNLERLDTAAQEQNYPDSQIGKVLIPGTEIIV